MEIRLDSLRPGAEAVITAIDCTPSVRRRLTDFGMVEGTRVVCCYRSPDGTLSALVLRGTTLAVRRTDLARITARRA